MSEQYCPHCQSLVNPDAWNCHWCNFPLRNQDHTLESIRIDIQAACQVACIVRDKMPHDAYRDELSRIATALAELCNDVSRLEMAEIDMRGAMADKEADEAKEREVQAWKWAKFNQGFDGDYHDWLELDDEERTEYEQGAAGIPTE